MRLKHEQQVLGLAAAAGLPATLAALALVWGTSFSTKLGVTLTLVIAFGWLLGLAALRRRIRHPLQTLSNILAGLREGDFSTRARGGRADDPLGELVLEVNALAQTLHEQRLGALEATALLRTVMAEIDLAVFAFDEERRLRLVNRAGERLLARPDTHLLGRSADELGLGECLTGEASRTLTRSFPAGIGRWAMRRSQFREGGRPHDLLVLTDLSRALRDEERQAWQRIVRVIGHEMNNSLAPIKSIAASLAGLILRQPRPGDWEEDMQRGLGVVQARADSLNRFMEAYARLARLPAPRKSAIEIAPLIGRVAGLETRLAVAVLPGPSPTLEGDRDQLEQLLINLVRNAVDAALEQSVRGSDDTPAPPVVRVGWSVLRSELEVRVEDNGPGLAGTANLFVPFFTTKPGGSGIGLALSRQIAEAHNGTLSLENNPGGAGCIARLRLPM